jgi:hypothetical protein
MLLEALLIGAIAVSSLVVVVRSAPSAGMLDGGTQLDHILSLSFISADRSPSPVEYFDNVVARRRSKVSECFRNA